MAAPFPQNAATTKEESMHDAAFGIVNDLSTHLDSIEDALNDDEAGEALHYVERMEKLLKELKSELVEDTIPTSIDEEVE